MALNIRNMRKWVKALRSGEYQQTTGALKNSVGFCCLGVACDISKVGRWDSYNCYTTDSDGDWGTLPVEVCSWLGIKSKNPSLRSGHGRKAASILNDDDGASFAQIADAIERTWPQIRLKRAATKKKATNKGER